MIDQGAATLTMDYMREKNQIAFPIVVNLQIMRIDELMTAPTALDINKINAIYTGLRALHSLIIAKKKDQAYDDEMQIMFANVERDISVSLIGRVGDIGKPTEQQKAAFSLLKVRDRILMQMGNANLIPDEENDAWPTFIPKNIEDEVYVPGPHDFDYKRELNDENKVSATNGALSVSENSQGSSNYGTNLERNLVEKQ